MGFSNENIERLMPKMKEEALKFSRRKRRSHWAKQKHRTKPALRSRGRFAAQIPLLTVLELTMNCRDGQKYGRGITTFERPAPNDRECGNRDAPTIANVYRDKPPLNSC